MAGRCISCEKDISDLASICSGCSEEFLSENIFAMSASPLISSPAIDRYREDSEPVLTIGERPEDELIFKKGDTVKKELESINIEDIDGKVYERIENRMNVILAELGVPKHIDFEDYRFSKKDTEVFSMLHYKLEELRDELDVEKKNPALYLRMANLFYHSFRCVDDSLFELDFRKKIRDDFRDNAEHYYEEAFGSDQGVFLYSLRNRAHLLLENGEFERAKDLFEEALAVEPDDLKSRLGLVSLLLEERQLEECEDELEDLREEFEEDPEVWYLRGELARARDKWGLAIQFFDRGLEKQDEFVPAMVSKGQLFYENDMLERGRGIFEEVLELEKENLQALKGLIKVLEKQGKSAETLKCLNRALAVESHDEGLWMKRGKVLQDLGNYEEALKDFQNALEIDSDLEEARKSIEDCMEKIG